MTLAQFIHKAVANSSATMSDEIKVQFMVAWILGK